jgi:ABC-type transporter Mla MlaB component
MMPFLSGLARLLQLSDVRSPMLRISANEAAGEPLTLRLDGQINGQWVKLLQRTCEAQLKKGAQVALDLKNVSFADRDGIALLRSLKDRRVEILNALPFIAEQIKREG